MGKRILIVDDDSRNIFALTATLKAKGFVISSCMDAQEAKKFMEQNKDVAIVLMDMMMPGMDGYEAMPFLRETEHYKNVPIVAVTAQAMVGDRERCLQAGATDYISKPIDVDRLMKVLEKYMEK